MAGFLGWLRYIKGSPEIEGNLTVGGALTLTGNANISGVLTAPQMPTNTIDDPGDAGAIGVTESGYCALTSAGAETRTLAIPTFAGQRISIALDTDGGDVVLTVAQPINQTGNNTATGADAGDHLSLEAITVGGALRWRVLANDGWALTTV